MGNDSYQTLEEIANNVDQVPMGVGHYCHIEHAILDKDCRIGNNVVIKGGDHLADMDDPNYCIRDGVVVVKKGGYICLLFYKLLCRHAIIIFYPYYITACCKAFNIKSICC